MPAEWVALLCHFTQEAAKGTKLVNFATATAMAEEAGLPTHPQETRETELRRLLHYLTQLGIVTWFDAPTLEDKVILVRVANDMSVY